MRKINRFIKIILIIIAIVISIIICGRIVIDRILGYQIGQVFNEDFIDASVIDMLFINKVEYSEEKMSGFKSMKFSKNENELFIDALNIKVLLNERIKLDTSAQDKIDFDINEIDETNRFDFYKEYYYFRYNFGFFVLGTKGENKKWDFTDDDIDKIQSGPNQYIYRKKDDTFVRIVLE